MKVIIVHTLEDALAALEAASELDVPITLQSAPDAIFYAGSLYLFHLFQYAKSAYPKVRATFIIDCHDAEAEAIAAMQMGHTHLRSSAPEELRAKLADIVAEHGIEFYIGDCQVLDLQNARDAKAACREWLETSAKTV